MYSIDRCAPLTERDCQTRTFVRTSGQALTAPCPPFPFPFTQHSVLALASWCIGDIVTLVSTRVMYPLHLEARANDPRVSLPAVELASSRLYRVLRSSIIDQPSEPSANIIPQESTLAYWGRKSARGHSRIEEQEGGVAECRHFSTPTTLYSARYCTA
jgi:hypothetical protein